MSEAGAATLLQITKDLLEKSREECCRRDLALQNLTPGGSEYVNDPERCVAFVKEVRDNNFALIKKFKLQRDALLEALQWISELADLKHEEDDKLRADSARTLRRIIERADATIAIVTGESEP